MDVLTIIDRGAFRPWGFPLASWAFAIRIWIAAVVALYVSFWLELEAPSSAILTVAILAEHTRGQALEKAAFRLVATGIGVAASIIITGIFSQTRDLLLIAFAIFTMVSASNLNYTTLQGIDGPLDSHELSALQLSNLLTATSIGIFMGITFAGLVAIIFGRHCAEIGATCKKPATA